MTYIIKALPHLSGQTTWAFCVHKFSSKQENFCGQTVLCKFCVYLSSQMRDSCTSVAAVLRVMRATPAYSTWKLRIRYGQRTCTARYGRVNSMVNARELFARYEGAWIQKKWTFFPRHRENNSSVLINQNDFQILQIPYWFQKLFTDIGNYFPISVIIFLNREKLDKCPLTSLTPFTDIV